MANLKPFAENYTLLNAKRTKESMVYGRCLSILMLRCAWTVGRAYDAWCKNLLGNTECYYIASTDSPLTVQDRLVIRDFHLFCRYHFSE